MMASIKLIFPTVENVRTSLEGYLAGGSLMYDHFKVEKQPFVKDLLHQWKSDALGRYV